jgi:uncharacterized repeat protein (TIGR01451 family)
VDDFSVDSISDSGQLAGTDAEVFGRCGNVDVLIGYPGFEAIDTGQPRVFSQNVRVSTGTDPVSLAERKALFENVMCWLHHCECSTFDVSLEASGSADSLPAGAEIDYTFLIRHNGECEATGTVMTDWLPPGIGFVRANSEQGSCVYDPTRNAVICTLGHLAKASTTQITVVATAQLPGTWTNLASVRINGTEVTTNNNSAQWITIVQGTSAGLSLLPQSTGSLQLVLNPAAPGPYLIQRSPDLRSWVNWRTNLVAFPWSESVRADGATAFFRAARP